MIFRSCMCRLSIVRGVDHSAHLGRERKERDDVLPSAPPGLHDRRVFLAPGAAGKVLQRLTGGLGARRGIDRPQGCRNRLALSPAGVIQRSDARCRFASVGDFADEGRGHLRAVHLQQISLDLPHRHAAGVQRDDLRIKASESPLVLGDDQRLEAAFVSRGTSMSTGPSSVSTVLPLAPLRWLD
jgi:hypothetical protein